MPTIAQSILIAESGDHEAALLDLFAHNPQLDPADALACLSCVPVYEV